jgi:hypothetical protein
MEGEKSMKVGDSVLATLGVDVCGLVIQATGVIVKEHSSKYLVNFCNYINVNRRVYSKGFFKATELRHEDTARHLEDLPMGMTWGLYSLVDPRHLLRKRIKSL